MFDTKWEYDVLVAHAEMELAELQAELNSRGQRGWELVSAEGGVYVFKRLVRPRERGRLGNM